MWIPYIHRGPSGPGRPDLAKDIFDEELYYHKSITPQTKLLFDETEERENLIDSTNSSIVAGREFMRAKLMKFLREEALYGLGELRDHYLGVLGRKRDANEEVSNTSYRNVWESIDSLKKARKQLRREMRKRRKEARVSKLSATGPVDGDPAFSASSSKASVNIGYINNAMPTKAPVRIRMEFDHGT